MDIFADLIYFNNNRTTRTDEAVLEHMTHLKSHEQTLAVSLSQLGGLLNAKPSELLFTRGTTESVNLAMLSAFNFYKQGGKHIITNATEHPAVLKCCAGLEAQGAMVTYLGTDREGLIDPAELKAAIGPDTIMVCIMAANNETGVIQPIEHISGICREHDIFFFSDASQFAGKERCDTKEFGFGGLAFGAHKMYGPEGIGMLYISETYQPLMEVIRSNYPGSISNEAIAGFGKAAEICQRDYWDNSSHISRLKNYLEHQLLDIEGLQINGSTRHRLYNTSNITFPDAGRLLTLKDRFDFADNQNRSSHVLKAMGLTEDEISRSFRFSFGKYNTLDEVKSLVEEIMK